MANGNGVNHLTQFAVEIIAEMFEQLPMDGLIHPIAIAYMQGLKAGKSAGTTPFDCPWPTENYGACLAWFSGYSIGNLASYNGHRSDDTKDLDKNQISDEPANTTVL